MLGFRFLFQCYSKDNEQSDGILLLFFSLPHLEADFLVGLDLEPALLEAVQLFAGTAI